MNEFRRNVTLTVCCVQMIATALISAGEWPVNGPKASTPDIMPGHGVNEGSSRIITMPNFSSWETAIRLMGDEPADIAKRVKDQVVYTPDSSPENEWRSAQDTWDNGQGDCEDFAVCVRDACKAKGLPAKVYVVSSTIDARAHAVTIVEYEGALWMSSNGSFEPVETVADARDKVAMQMGWWHDDVRLAMEDVSQGEARIPALIPVDEPIMVCTPFQKRI